MAQIQFAFCLHNHQPIGNLPQAFEKAYEKAYAPLLSLARRFPHLRLVLHYSGSLLLWLQENRPDIFTDIATLVKEGRAELLTGGFYEPILPLLPDRDKQGQITALTRYLKEHFGASATGLWLTERVWQADLVAPLRQAGVRYTIVDDNNFRQAGIAEPDSLGHFTVADAAGETREIFPINATLRHMIPFASPEKVIDHLRWLVMPQADSPGRTGEGPRLALFADDGEKFGEWPGTYDWVYGQGWLERFFGLLGDNREWLKTTTLGEFLEEAPSRGRIELPAGSYEEMMQWSGGSWWKFLERYPESNLLYRKMLAVSEETAKSAEDSKARDLLYRGQANDAYWHGVFGGLYLLHLRTHNYRNLLQAENLVNRPPEVVAEKVDFDGDGREEVIVRAPQMNAYLHSVGGQIFELDHREISWNLLATLTRRREVYHEKLAESEEGRHLLPLQYDWYLRRALIDHFLRADTTLEALANCEYGEQGDFVNQPYEMEIGRDGLDPYIILERNGGVWAGEEFLPVTVNKRLVFSPDKPQIMAYYQITNQSAKKLAVWFACENNLVLSAGNAPGRYYRLNGKACGLPPEARAEHEGIRRLGLVDEWLGGGVELRFPRPTTVWTFPVETISQGLEGFARSYQGSCVTAHWKLKLLPRRPQKFSFAVVLETAG